MVHVLTLCSSPNDSWLGESLGVGFTTTCRKSPNYTPQSVRFGLFCFEFLWIRSQQRLSLVVTKFYCVLAGSRHTRECDDPNLVSATAAAADPGRGDITGLNVRERRLSQAFGWTDRHHRKSSSNDRRINDVQVSAVSGNRLYAVWRQRGKVHCDGTLSLRSSRRHSVKTVPLQSGRSSSWRQEVRPRVIVINEACTPPLHVITSMWDSCYLRPEEPVRKVPHSDAS
ncbi:hypothetical protein RRG08_013095 [Elysia crispata]|uniref:Uncharacterized protein n=1 Tax=Elysia crispata TaxID=231223 RepID=A0AAE1DQ69_9GAST|nr:hypothetical protein RRG08_013095 [Elysia crispata]